MKDYSNVIIDSYKQYRFKNPRYKVSADYNDYKVIANAFFKNLFERIVTTGDLIELPNKLGAFVIELYDVDEMVQRAEKADKKLTKRSRDYQSEKAYFEKFGKRTILYFDSEEYDGKMWRFSWLKKGYARFKNQKMYSFNLVRSNIRSTSNKTYSDKSKRLTVHDFFKEEGHKIYRQFIKKFNPKTNNDAQNQNDTSRIDS